MKKLGAVFLLSLSAFAAGSVTQQSYGLPQGNPTVWVTVFRWTGDATTGSVPNTSAQLNACPNACSGWFVVQAETVPGTPAPTSGYSVALNDAAGVDALAGAAASLSASTAQSFAASTAAPPVQGTITLAITGQSVASAQGIVYVFLQKPGTVNVATLGRGAIASSANWLTIANPPFVDARRYNFAAQSPGATLAAGSCSFPMTPLPSGVVIGEWLYISGGTGTAESVPITGISGSTVTATCANNHSGNYSVQSVNGGICEALNSPGAVLAYVPTSVTVHGPCTIPGVEKILGNAQAGTTLTIASDFPTSANGVFIGTPTAGTGPEVSDLTFQFTEPDSTVIASYTHWPPALYMVGVTRFIARNLYVFAGWDGINMTGNSGGAIIENFQASTFNKGINIDGSQDSVYLTKVRFWPYGLTANQTTVFQTNSTTYGVYCGRMDDLHITDFFAENTNGLYFYLAGDGAPNIVHMSNVTIDTVSQMQILAGYIEIDGLYVSVGTVGSFSPITVGTNVSEVKINNAFFYPGGSTSGTNPYIALSSGILHLSNSWFWTGAYDVSSIIESGGELIATGNYFNRTANTSYTNATVSVTSGRVTFVGNRTIDKGTGTGNFVAIAGDNWNQVRGNTFIGWGASFPANPTSGTYESDTQSYMRAMTLSSGLKVGSVAFAGLGAAPAAGNAIYCTDCTTAATCAGSGSGHMAISNGTNWTCQ